MSIYGLPQYDLGRTRFAEAPPSVPTIGDIYQSTLEDQLRVRNQDARYVNLEEAYENLNARIAAETGANDLWNPITAMRDASQMPQTIAAWRREIEPLRAKRPDLPWDDLFSEPERAARERMRQAAEEAGEIAMRRGMGDPSEFAGYQVPIIGGMLGVGQSFVYNLATDPAATAAQLAAGVVGSFASVPDAAVNLIGFAAGGARKSIAKNAALNAAANVGGQAILSAPKQADYEAAGLPYGWRVWAEEVAAAGIAGGILDVGIRAPIRTARFLRGDQGLGGVFRDAPAPVVVERMPDRPTITPEVYERARADDFKAIKEIAQKTGAIQSPVVKGAIDHAEMGGAVDEQMIATLRKMGVDNGEGLRTLAAVMANPDAYVRMPEPVPAATVRPMRTEALDLARTRGPEIQRMLQATEGTVAANMRGQVAAAFEAGIPEIVEAVTKAVQKVGDGQKPEDAAADVGAAFARLEQAEGQERLTARIAVHGGARDVRQAAAALRQFPDLNDDSLPSGGFTATARAIARLDDAAYGMMQRGEAPPALARDVDLLVPPEQQAQVLADLVAAGVQTSEQVKSLVPDLIRRSQREPGPAGIDDPAGPEAKRQVEVLEEQHADAIAEAMRPIEERKAAEQRVEDLKGEIAKIETKDGGMYAIREDGTPARADSANLLYAVADADVEAHAKLSRELGDAQADLSRRQPMGSPLYRLVMEEAALRRQLDVYRAVHAALRLANRILPPEARVEVSTTELVDPVTGRTLDAMSDTLTGDITLAAYALDPQARLGHEALHTLVTRGLVSPEEIGMLAQAARDEGLFTPATEASYRVAYQGRKNIETQIAEEAAAAFVEARIKRETRGEAPQMTATERIAQAIANMIERVRNALKGYGFQTADDVRTAVLNGTMAQRKAVRSWMRSNDVTAMAVQPGMAAIREDGTPGLDMSPEARKARAEAWRFPAWQTDVGRLVGSQTWYHGANRSDRIAKSSKFDPRRATSGPMAFFTNNTDIASNYAKGKPDTSLFDDGDIPKYFTVVPKDLGTRGRTPISVEQSWYFLTPEQKQSIVSRMRRVGYENIDEATGPWTLHPEGVEASLNGDHLMYLMRESRGNPLSALRKMWLEGGDLHGNEGDLAEIFRLAGYPHKISQETAPWYEAQGVLPVYLRMINPIDTHNNEVLQQIVIPALEEKLKSDRTRRKEYGADAWDKNTRYTPKEWVAQIKDDTSKGINSYVWSSIPDKVTAVLRELGFDGILDRGNKGGGGTDHAVAIPFTPQQVRSVNAAFDPRQSGSPNLMFAFAGERAQTADLSALARAKEMDAEGPPRVLDKADPGYAAYDAHRTKIWEETGWFRGVDGKWRWEVDDSGAYLNLSGALADGWKAGQKLPLDQLLSHRRLFEAYPDMSATGIAYREFPTGFDDVAAAFSRSGDLISLNSRYRDFGNDAEMRQFALHETQHGVQAREAFERGGNARVFTSDQLAAERARIMSVGDGDGWTSVGTAAGDMTDAEVGHRLYMRLAGEVEARTVQKRMGMTPEQRRARPPWRDYDVPESEQIVRMEGGAPEAMYAIADAETGRSMRRDLDALGYYSQALEAARGLKQAKGTPEQMLSQLKKAGVKDAEIAATFLREFMGDRTSVTRDEIVAHLEQNRVGLREAIYNSPNAPEWGANNPPAEGSQAALLSSQFGDDGTKFTDADGNYIDDIAKEIAGRPVRENGMDVYEFSDGSRLMITDGAWDVAGKPTRGKWSGYSLDPSNPTYRETVLHLPPTVPDFAKFKAESLANGVPEAEVARNYQRLVNDPARIAREDGSNFQSGHFPEPNIVGHMMTSMVKHEGQPVFLVDQIQSDWGQKLRDGGVRDEAKIAELRQQIKQGYKDVNRLKPADLPMGKIKTALNAIDFYGSIEAMRANSDLVGIQEALQYADMLTPEFVKATKDLQLREAELRTAEAATPGNPLVNTTDQWVNTTLRRAVRQAAEADAQFIAIPHGDTVLSYNPGDEGGMRGFYGSRTSEGIVPKNLRKLLEKLDKGSAKPLRIDELETPTQGMKGEGFTVFPLTDTVKQRVMTEGQAMFAMGRDAGEPAELGGYSSIADALSSGAWREASDEQAAAYLKRVIASSNPEQHVGIRVTQEPLLIGSEAPASRVWDDGDPTDDMLDGASAVRIKNPDDVDAIENALRAASSYDGNYIAVITSRHAFDGQDNGEIIMRDNRVVAAIGRTDRDIYPDKPSWEQPLVIPAEQMNEGQPMFAIRNAGEPDPTPPPEPPPPLHADMEAVDRWGMLRDLAIACRG